MNEALIKARETLAAKKAAGEKVIRLTPIEAAKADPKSKTKAIKAKCYECMGGEDSGNWRKDVANCSSFQCPLHHLRPGASKDSPEQ